MMWLRQPIFSHNKVLWSKILGLQISFKLVFIRLFVTINLAIDHHNTNHDSHTILLASESWFDNPVKLVCLRFLAKDSWFRSEILGFDLRLLVSRLSSQLSGISVFQAGCLGVNRAALIFAEKIC